MESLTFLALDWDALLKIASLAAVLAGVPLGLWKYLDTAGKNLRKPFWERQLALYVEATSAAATLASSSDIEMKSAAEATFWRLYFGPLAIVEDEGVEAAMVKLGRCLQLQDYDKGELEKLSLALAHACRDSIGNTWSMTLPELKGRYNK